MRSPLDHEGFKLLDRWSASRAEIHLSFRGLDNRVSLTGVGVLIAFDQGGMGLAGGGFEFLLDLSEAAFEKVGSGEESRKRGLNPSQYTESAEISLGNGGKLLLIVPQVRPTE